MFRTFLAMALVAIMSTFAMAADKVRLAMAVQRTMANQVLNLPSLTR